MIKSLLFASAIASAPMMHSMKPEALTEYAKKRESLTSEEIHLMLDQGKDLALKTGLIQTLTEGGIALFPHASIIR